MKRISLILLLSLCGWAAPCSAQDLLTNLIAAWKLDEASGNAIDAHGSNDLTDVNAVGAGTGLVYPTARDFEVTDAEYFAIADNANLSTGDIAFTIAIWFKLESNTGFPGLLNKYSSSAGQREFTVYVNGIAVKFQYSSDGTAEALVSANDAGITTGVWYFVVVDHDPVGNVCGIQVNNGTRETAAHSGGVFDSTSPFEIGSAISGGSNSFDGLIGPVYFWKRALTTEERTALWAGGSGFAYPFGAPTGEGSGQQVIIIQ